MLLKAELPEIEDQEKAQMKQRAVSSATSLTVYNNEGLDANDYIIVGTPKTDGAEIRKISSVSGANTVNIDALDNAHEEGTIITKILYNQVKFYRATAKDGTYAVITTEDIEVDSEYTAGNDAARAPTSYLKIRYYNETTSAYSD